MGTSFILTIIIISCAVSFQDRHLQFLQSSRPAFVTFTFEGAKCC